MHPARAKWLPATGAAVIGERRMNSPDAWARGARLPLAFILLTAVAVSLAIQLPPPAYASRTSHGSICGRDGCPRGPGSAERSRHCGHFKFRGERVKVEISRGRVSCAQAKKVFRSFLTRRAREKTSTPRSTRIGAWRCDAGPGQASCFRHGSDYLNARDYILAYFAPARPSAHKAVGAASEIR